MRRSSCVMLCVGLLLASPQVRADSDASSENEVALHLVVSDRPVNLPWVIAEEKGWLEALSVPIELEWLDYVTGLDAFAAGHADGAVMTHADALVIGATTRRKSTAVLLSGSAAGSDVIVGRPGVDALADLRNGRAGVEFGFVSHRLLLGALSRAGVERERVSMVNAPPDTWEALLKSGDVDAVAAWEPGASRLAAAVSGATLLQRSEAGTAPSELLYGSRESLAAQREEWMHVVRLWYRSVAFMTAPAHRKEVLALLSPRLELESARIEALLDGLALPGAARALEIWPRVVAADRAADALHLEAGIYPQAEANAAYHDFSWVERASIPPLPPEPRH